MQDSEDGGKRVERLKRHKQSVGNAEDEELRPRRYHSFLHDDRRQDGAHSYFLGDAATEEAPGAEEGVGVGTAVDAGEALYCQEEQGEGEMMVIE
jgi:hypothetical protein